MKMMDCVDCIAIPNADSIIDVIRPDTGLTWHFGHTLDQVRARPDHAAAVVMSLDEFCQQKATRQRTAIEWIETTECEFSEMLEVLPPALVLPDLAGFMVGEPYDHDAMNGQPRFSGYRKSGNRFMRGSRAMTRDEFRAEAQRW